MNEEDEITVTVETIPNETNDIQNTVVYLSSDQVDLLVQTIENVNLDINDRYKVITDMSNDIHMMFYMFIVLLVFTIIGKGK